MPHRRCTTEPPRFVFSVAMERTGQGVEVRVPELKLVVVVVVVVVVVLAVVVVVSPGNAIGVSCYWRVKRLGSQHAIHSPFKGYFVSRRWCVERPRNSVHNRPPSQQKAVVYSLARGASYRFCVEVSDGRGFWCIGLLPFFSARGGSGSVRVQVGEGLGLELKLNFLWGGFGFGPDS